MQLAAPPGAEAAARAFYGVLRHRALLHRGPVGNRLELLAAAD
ncbi:MAG TPA: hypothetical protein VF781_15560 [Solirubrobacteraceae bacterium]